MTRKPKLRYTRRGWYRLVWGMEYRPAANREPAAYDMVHDTFAFGPYADAATALVMHP